MREKERLRWPQTKTEVMWHTDDSILPYPTIHQHIVCVFGLVSLAPVRERNKHIPKSLRLERQSGFV